MHREMIDLPIDAITVTDRIRKPRPEDQTRNLAQSIEMIGLLNPITVTEDHTLIAGYHRIQAYKMLNRPLIPAFVWDSTPDGQVRLFSEQTEYGEETIEAGKNHVRDLQKLAEIDENLIRYELNVLETAAHLAERKRIYERLFPITAIPGRRKNQYTEDDEMPIPENVIGTPTFVEDTSAKMGKSKQTVYDLISIENGLTENTKSLLADTEYNDRKTDLMKLAKEAPDMQEKIAEKLTSGEAKGYQDARRRLAGERVHKTEPMEGKYKVIYADPPWSYGGSMNRETYGTADMHYPTMALGEICDLPVPDICEENAVLYLWATSPLLPEALKVMGAWGFTYKASFIWDKQKHVMGHYNSVRHEFLLVGTKGSCLPEVTKLYPSVVSEERTEHSAKPDSFRDMIAALYPSAARVELFGRKQSEGWDTWGNQA